MVIEKTDDSVHNNYFQILYNVHVFLCKCVDVNVCVHEYKY
jgi:hypothetical protein